MKAYFKDYWRRIFTEVNKIELIYWWIMRGLMIFALIYTIKTGHGLAADEYKGSNPWQQVAANLVGMFAYEIIQLFPKKSILRKLSYHFQDITALGFLLGSFGGAFLNFYYSIPMYDKILHATGTAEGVYIGYELVSAMQLKLKKTCPYQIVALCALGIGFVLASGWELFEFCYDQFFGGDAQHWNIQNAIDQAGGIENVFSMFKFDDMELFERRFPLMDTMSDIVMNFVGGFIMYFVVRFCPYRHKGKGDINRLIEENKVD